MPRRSILPFSVGEGRTWVRAFRRGRDGKLFLEWFDTVTETESDTGAEHEVKRRRRKRLQGEQTEERLVAAAVELSKRFGQLEDTQPVVGLTALIADYLKEVTPTKSKGKQGHDRRAARIWLAFFGAQPEQERGPGRMPHTLDRVDWDRFVEQRGAGEIPGWKHAVGDRQVQYDLKWMIAVLNWGSGSTPKGSAEPYVRGGVSPWRPEIRRAQRWRMPRERSPKRPAMTDEVREALIAHAPSWQFEAALKLERAFRRRNSAIRRLLWSDVDLQERTIRWRRETDKTGRQEVTPIFDEALEVLRSLPSRGIGRAPVFPSATDPSKPTGRDTFQTWLRRAKARFLVSLESEAERQAWRRKMHRVGFHAEKHAGVRDPDFRALSPKAQESISGTSWATLRTVYDDLTPEEIRAEVEAQRKARSGTN